MAGKRKNTSPQTSPDDKSRAPATVPTTLHLTPENRRLLKLKAIDEDSDMSDVINRLIAQNFAGWHIRRGRGEVAGSSPVEPEIQPSVSIPSVTSRIDAIGRRSTIPLDQAIVSLSSDQP